LLFVRSAHRPTHSPDTAPSPLLGLDRNPTAQLSPLARSAFGAINTPFAPPYILYSKCSFSLCIRRYFRIKSRAIQSTTK